MKNISALGYYSHHYKTFNTSEEQKQYSWLKMNLNGFIINPNIHFKEKNPFILNQYWQTIDRINYLVVKSYRNKIDRASYYEVKQSLLRRINVYELKKLNNSYFLRRVVGLKIVNDNNLSAYAILKTRTIKDYSLKTQKKGTP
jgi:hypothetical protein